MKRVLDIILSIKTAFALFLAGIVICFVGSLTLPANLAFFSGIDDTPLFTWLAEAGKPGLTWWIYALMVLLALLSVNTIFCTAEALLKMSGLRNFALKLSPQVMHIGVLLVLLGHLLTASIGTKEDVLVPEGQEVAAGGNVSMRLIGLDVKEDEGGYLSDWMASLRLSEEDGSAKEAVLRPAHPVYFGGLGFYFKSIRIGDERSALIRICRDPGALWALAGGVLVAIGGLIFLYARFKD